MLRAVRDRGRAQHGFTLIEVLVSALIVTLIATAVAGALIANADFTSNQSSRSQAETLAEQDQERLKGLSAEQLDGLSQTYTAKLDGTPYTVTSKAWYLNNTNGQSCTTSGGAGATYFKTISTVSVTNSAGSTSTLATDESVITPPAGGSMLAQFHDQTASPLAGVSVTASGPDSDAATSDSTGCVIFAALPTGTYNLIYSDLGYVDPNGNASPLTDTATVASTGIAPPGRGNPISLGQAGGFTAGFVTTATNGSGNPYTGYADGLSWFSSGGAGIPMASFRTNSSASTVSSLKTTNAAGATGTYGTGLFPFVSSQTPVSYNNNYQVWAGTCRAEQPPAGYDMVSVPPGWGPTQPQNTQEPTLQLTLTWNGTAKPPADVKLIFNSTGTGTSCSDTWGPETASASNAGPSTSYFYGLPFASSVASGAGASASGLTGTVQVCADYLSGSTYYKPSTPPSVTPSFTSVSTQTIALASSGSGTTTGKC